MPDFNNTDYVFKISQGLRPPGCKISKQQSTNFKSYFTHQV